MGQMNLTEVLEERFERGRFKTKVAASLKLLYPRGVRPEEFTKMLDSLIGISDAIEESNSVGSAPFYYN